MPDSSRTAVVTGGSGAIGGEICRRLASDGFNVVVHYGHNQQAADSVVADIRHSGGTAIAVQADISDEAQVIRLFEDTINQFGGIDVVVANAGTIIDGPVAEYSLEDFEHLIAANLRGSFLTLRQAARSVRDGGRIVFISSQLAERPRAGTGIYSATKAAVDAMLVSLSRELGDRNIAVNSVRPGATTPGMVDKRTDAEKQTFANLSAFGRLGTPADIAGVVSFLAGSEGGWITGQHIRADGGMSN